MDVISNRSDRRDRIAPTVAWQGGGEANASSEWSRSSHLAASTSVGIVSGLLFGALGGVFAVLRMFLVQPLRADGVRGHGHAAEARGNLDCHLPAETGVAHRARTL